jgi:hypothetical protein
MIPLSRLFHANKQETYCIADEILHCRTDAAAGSDFTKVI